MTMTADRHDLQLLGTCAGLEHEGDPAGPRDIHGYTMLYVPPGTVIDFTMEARAKMRYWGVSEESVSDILITHSHYDHLDEPSIIAYARDRWEQYGRKTSVHADATSSAALAAAAVESEATVFLSVEAVSAGARISLAGGAAAVAIPSSHWTAATPLNYILEFRGREILYAVDSAAFTAEMIEAMQGRRFDALIADCTWIDQAVDPAASGHMNFPMVCHEVAALRERGLLRPEAPCYITHLALSTPADYEAFAPRARALGLEMTYDGMPVRLD